MAADMRSIICCHKQNWSAIVAEVAVVERASGGSDAAGQPEVSDLSGSKFGEAADGSGGNEIRMKRRSEWYPSLSAPHLPATAGQPVVKLPRARSLIHTLSGPPVAVPGYERITYRIWVRVDGMDRGACPRAQLNACPAQRCSCPAMRATLRARCVCMQLRFRSYNCTEKFVSRLSRVTARGDASQPCAQPVRARAATAKSAERVCCSSALLCLVLIFA